MGILPLVSTFALANGIACGTLRVACFSAGVRSYTGIIRLRRLRNQGFETQDR
ncbi:MAG: hypothetical protein V7L23_15740 [Nostoc sp.]|uniref:hypothetical protein n=1 Tax=Nostoc sp. TaxID=1180 RepID=UPI002FEF3350